MAPQHQQYSSHQPAILRAQISQPKNFERRLHIDKDFNWSGQDPYAIFSMEDLLGKGAYGSVYKVRFQQTGFTMAAKTINVETDQTQSICKEIELLKRVSHPNLVSYYGSCLAKESTELWILMDFCGGGSVSDLLQSIEGIAERPLVWILQSALKGLSYLHSQQIIHRDVKAANILLTELGEVKIADFGVSDQVSHTLCARRTVIGTPFWMAPEVISGKDYNCSADIWSLGITAIEMAEGAPPLARKFANPMHALFQIPYLPPPRLQQSQDATRHWSQQFHDFIDCGLKKEPAERKTAAVLLAEHPIFRLYEASVCRKELLELMVSARKRREKKRSLTELSSPGITATQRKKLQKKRKSSAIAAAIVQPRLNRVNEETMGNNNDDDDDNKDNNNTVIVHHSKRSSSGHYSAESSPKSAHLFDSDNNMVTMLVRNDATTHSAVLKPLLSSPKLIDSSEAHEDNHYGSSNLYDGKHVKQLEANVSAKANKELYDEETSDTPTRHSLIGLKITGMVALGLVLAVFYYKHQSQSCQLKLNQLALQYAKTAANSAASAADNGKLNSGSSLLTSFICRILGNCGAAS